MATKDCQRRDRSVAWEEPTPSALLTVMTQLRTPFTLTIIATITAWLVWLLTIARLDPATAGMIGYSIFYLALFCAVGGSATIVGLFVRRRTGDQGRAIHIAIRQGALTGLAVTIAVFLQTRELLTWLNLLFLIAALTLLELFIVSLRRTAESARRTAESTNGFESTNGSV